MMSFVREKNGWDIGLSVVRRGPDNASEVCAKWRDHKMSQFLSPSRISVNSRAIDGYTNIGNHGSAMRER